MLRVDSGSGSLRLYVFRHWVRIELAASCQGMWWRDVCGRRTADRLQELQGFEYYVA